ncbi:formylglycine-generating enzyme family protein [Jannaschia donghaensis]|uniref:Aerobic sulfatase maturase family protein n=1 Tax=Jannaschia donghaensis TaxID=420998 RepID=A0A0M6YJF2_9RHOB|nr:formylglycine-generating enzyme family protein [Jannaschia donghaensis]CTQ50488.1 aerobic sulfatase maturase family protein [Jannaschia donghaensis]
MKKLGRSLRAKGGMLAATVVAIATGATAQTYTLSDGEVVARLETFRECDVCPEMIALPQEPFTMGAEPWESVLVSGRRMPSGERRGNDFEGPVHRVEMDLPLAMGRNEVTYDEWMACVEADGCDHIPPTEIGYAGSPVDVSGRHPVLNISYFDILQYAEWLNARVGAQVYRLPTEAEWEFAARAGTTTPFAQGDRLTPAQAAYSEAATARSEDRPEPPRPAPGPRERPVPVDALDAANGWGLRHMSGNATEQTMSCYSDRHLGLQTASAYLADARAAQSCRRVIKGSAFLANMYLTRPGARGSIPEENRSELRGFRLVREMEEGNDDE